MGRGRSIFWLATKDAISQVSARLQHLSVNKPLKAAVANGPLRQPREKALKWLAEQTSGDRVSLPLLIISVLITDFLKSSIPQPRKHPPPSEFTEEEIAVLGDLVALFWGIACVGGLDGYVR